VKAEDVKVEEKVSDALIEDYAKAMDHTLEAMKAELSEGQKAYFEHRAQVTKTLDMLWDAAKVTDEKEVPAQIDEEGKPAAKKTATRKAKADKADAEETVGEKPKAARKQAHKAGDEEPKA
ncbi:MAG TPA: hypothetical protein PLR69_03565, partial [Candidatus Limiplasma sp.]|nr:hypothetical protein [Candidatus Limiplasma sp.]